MRLLFGQVEHKMLDEIHNHETLFNNNSLFGGQPSNVKSIVLCERKYDVKFWAAAASGLNSELRLMLAQAAPKRVLITQIDLSN